ncbi:MAG: MATE family efflux transporter [Pseudomonadota bacterium]
MCDNQKPAPPATAFSLIRTALPIGAFYLTEIIVGLTDLAVVGALGATELAAVGLGKTILLSVMVIGFAVLSVATVLMAESLRPSRCGAVVLASIIIVIPISGLALIAAHASSVILHASGYDPELVAAFESYADILAWAIAPTLLFAVFKNVLIAVGKTSIITWLSVGIVAGNLVASIVFVHGIGDWPGIGVAGAALATVAVNAIATAAIIFVVLRAGYVRLQKLGSGVVLRFMTDILRLGWAAGAQQALESVLFIVVLYLLGLYSTAWLAAGTVVFTVMELNFAASGALGEVLSARIAAARSQGRGAIRRLLRLSSILTSLVAICLGFTFGVFAEATVSLFSSSDIQTDGRLLMISLLQWTAPFFVADALQVLYIHALRGLRQTVMPMILSTSCYWVIGLGGGMFIAEPLGFGPPGIWIGFCLGLSSAAVLLATMAFRAAKHFS